MNTLSPNLRWSMFFCAFAFLVILLTGVLFDSALASVPQAVQRAMIMVLIVLPNLAGSICGFLSFFKQPRRVVLSIVFFMLNLLSALFYTLLVFIAG